MALMVSAEARWWFSFLTGDDFPDTDEDLLRVLADAWDGAGRRFGAELGPQLRVAVGKIRSGFVGEAARAFAAVMAVFVEGRDNYIDVSAGFFRQVARILRELAVDVEYMKYVVVLELSMLASEFAFAAAMEVLFGPWPEIWFGSRAATARKRILQAIGRVRSALTRLGALRTLVVGFGVSMGNQVGITAAAQTVQFAKHTRVRWNNQYFQDAAVVGVFGGVAAPVTGALGHKLGRAMNNALDERGVLGTSKRARDWHHQLAHGVAHIVHESAHEGLTATLATAALTHQFSSWADFTAGASSGVARVSAKIFGHLINDLGSAAGATTLARQIRRHREKSGQHHDHESRYDARTGHPGPAHPDNGFFGGYPTDTGPGHYNGYDGGGLRGGGTHDDSRSTYSSSGDSSQVDPDDVEIYHAPVPVAAADRRGPAGMPRHAPVSSDGDRAASSPAGPSAPQRSIMDSHDGRALPGTGPRTALPAPAGPATARAGPAHPRGDILDPTTLAGRTAHSADTAGTPGGMPGPDRAQGPGNAPEPGSVPGPGGVRTPLAGGIDGTAETTVPSADAGGGHLLPGSSSAAGAGAPSSGRNVASGDPATSVAYWGNLRGGAGSSAAETSDGSSASGEMDLDASEDVRVAGDPAAAGARAGAAVLDAGGGMPVPAADSWLAVHGGAETIAVHTAFQQEFGTVEAGVADARLAAAQPSSFGNVGEVMAAVKDAGHGAAAVMLTTSVKGRQRAWVVANIEGSLGIVRTGPGGLEVVSSWSPVLTLLDLASIRAVVTDRSGRGVRGEVAGPDPAGAAAAGQPAAQVRPARDIAGMWPAAHGPAGESPAAGRPAVHGVEEALVFHWRRRAGWPGPLVRAGHGRTGMLTVSLKVLGGPGRYALAAVSPAHPVGGRDRMWIVTTEKFSDTRVADGLRVMVIDARTGKPVSWAGFARAGAIDAVVTTPERQTPATPPRSPAGKNLIRVMEGIRFDYTLRAEVFEQGLPGYLSDDYSGRHAIEPEFARLARTLQDNIRPRKVRRLGTTTRAPGTRNLGEWIALLDDLYHTITRDDLLDLPPVPQEMHDWQDAATDPLHPLHQRALASGAWLSRGPSWLTYRLLTLAVEANGNWDAGLNLGLLRLGLLKHSLEHKLATFHEVMLAAAVTDPHRDTEHADPGLAYADNYGRYRRLHPIGDDELAHANAPFPDQPATDWHTTIAQLTQARIEAIPAQQRTDQRIRYLEQRMEPHWADPDPAEARKNAAQDPWPEQASWWGLEPRSLLTFLERKWHQVQAHQAGGWTPENITKAAGTARYGLQHFRDAHAIASSHPDWPVLEPHATAVTKILAHTLARHADDHTTHDTAHDLVTALAVGLTYRRGDLDDKGEPQPRWDRTEPLPDAPFDTEQPLPHRWTFTDEEFRQAHQLVATEIARLPLRDVPTGPDADDQPTRYTAASQTAQAIHNGLHQHDATQTAAQAAQAAAQAIVEKYFATDEWRQRQKTLREQEPRNAPPPAPPWEADPWLAELWWHGGPQSGAARFRDFERDHHDVHEPGLERRLVDGPLFVPGRPGWMRDVLSLDRVLTFLEFFSPPGVGDPRKLITAHWFAPLSHDKPIATAMKGLAGKFRPRTFGVLLIVPKNHDKTSTHGETDHAKRPFALGVVVDSFGPHLVDLRGKHVAWPRYLRGTADIYGILLRPDGNSSSGAVAEAGIHRPEGAKFAHNFDAAFQAATHPARDNEPGRRPVLLPRNFPNGRDGIDDILELVTEGGRGTSGVVYATKKSGKREVYNVYHNGTANFLNSRLRNASRSDIDGLSLLQAIITAPDRTVLAGHQMFWIDAPGEPTGRTPPVEQEPLYLSHALDTHEFTDIAFRHALFAAPDQLNFAGNDAAAIAKIVAQVVSHPELDNAALVAATFPFEESSRRIVWYLSGGPRYRDDFLPLFDYMCQREGITKVYAAMFPAREKIRPVLAWAAADWLAQLRSTPTHLWQDAPGVREATASIQAYVEARGWVTGRGPTPGTDMMRRMELGLRSTFGGFTSEERQQAYEDFWAHPSAPHLAQLQLATTTVFLILSAPRLRPETTTTDLMDAVAYLVMDDEEGASPVRGVRYLAEALELHTRYVNSADGETGPVDLVAQVTTRDPQPFGTGEAAMTRLVSLLSTGHDQHSATTTGSPDSHTGEGPVTSVVIRRSPTWEYEAAVLVVHDGRARLETIPDRHSTQAQPTPQSWAHDAAIFALGKRSGTSFVAGVSRPEPDSPSGDSSPGESPAAGSSEGGPSVAGPAEMTQRGGAGPKSELTRGWLSWPLAALRRGMTFRTRFPHPVTLITTVRDSREYRLHHDDDRSGMATVQAVHAAWFGRPFDTATTELQPTGADGFRGLAQVADSLPTHGAAAHLATNADQPTLTIVRFHDHTYLIDTTRRRPTRLTFRTIPVIGRDLGKMQAAVFDANHNRLPLIPLDDFQNALYDKMEQESKWREKAATGEDLQLAGVTATMTEWAGKLYLTATHVIPAEIVAALTATLNRDIVALVIGADAEDPIRWMIFPPLGRPLPVEPEDLPSEAQAALAELNQPT